MYIRAKKINEIIPYKVVRGYSEIKIKVDMTKDHAEELFYSMYELYGVESIDKWLRAHGYEVVGIK